MKRKLFMLKLKVSFLFWDIMAYIIGINTWKSLRNESKEWISVINTQNHARNNLRRTLRNNGR